MPTEYQEIFAALARPFEHGQVKQVPRGDRKVDYISARTVMNRLDEVVGFENWWDDFVPLAKSVICRLSIRLPDGHVITKADAGGYAGMQDEGDDEKSGFSDAFKRAAVKFGVGRYLYRDGVPGSSGNDYPGRNVMRAPADPPREPDFSSLPRAGTGAAFHWFKDLGTYYKCPVMKKVEELAGAEGLPGQFKDWTQDDLDKMARRAVNYCRRLDNYKGELDHLVPIAGAGDGDRETIREARDSLERRAAAVWVNRGLGTRPVPADIDQICREISDGQINSLYACTDAELMTQVAQTMQKLLPAAKAIH